MEYLVMECGLSYAVVLDQDGRILKVPNLGYTVGQSLKDVVLLPERPVRQQVLHKRIARWSALAACLCLLLLGSWVWQSPIGTVRMQINPDVLLSVNRFDRVVALEGLNEDGTALIDGYRAYGQEMKTVSDELADRAMELGYLSAGGQITLTVDSEKGDWKTAAEELLLLELEVHFEQRVTVTVDGKRPSAGQESSEDIIITPPGQTKISTRMTLTMIRRETALMKMTIRMSTARMTMGAMILTRSSAPRETQRTSRITHRPFPKAMILTMMAHRTATITTILSCRMMMQMTAIPMMTMKTTTNTIF